MLEISRENKDKLKRYMINSDPFLWNVLDSKNKKGRLRELKAMGFLAKYSEGTNANYGRINQDLLVELGIEGVLEKIVIPRVKTLFTEDVLNYLRRCWEQGQTPTLDYFRKQGLYKRQYGAREEYDKLLHTDAPPSGFKDPAFVFVQIQSQFNFVERWTVFAGLWFEEIEPMLSSAGWGATESTR